MIRRNRLTHGNVGRYLMTKFDYQWSVYVKKVSRDADHPSPENTFNGWMQSSSHHSNFLDRRFDELRIGAATGDFSGPKITAWTVDLATRR
jgi:uncharacterized protein YkwD